LFGNVAVVEIKVYNFKHNKLRNKFELKEKEEKNDDERNPGDNT